MYFTYLSSTFEIQVIFLKISCDFENFLQTRLKASWGKSQPGASNTLHLTHCTNFSNLYQRRMVKEIFQLQENRLYKTLKFDRVFSVLDDLCQERATPSNESEE